MSKNVAPYIRWWLYIDFLSILNIGKVKEQFNTLGYKEFLSLFTNYKGFNRIYFFIIKLLKNVMHLGL